jgi:hypothetical protein
MDPDKMSIFIDVDIIGVNTDWIVMACSMQVVLARIVFLSG